MCYAKGIAAYLGMMMWIPVAVAQDVNETFWDSILNLISAAFVTETFVTTPAVTLVANSSRDSLMVFPFSSRSRSSEFGFTDESLAQYATFRSPGDVYLHGKAGYMWESSREKDQWCAQSIDDMVEELDTRGAFGLGAGYRLSNGRQFEIEYSVNRRDEQLLRIGYTF